MTRDYETAPRARTAVVDDDPDVLDSMKFLLKAAGYEVRAYPTADQFLADEEARPDCLIVDQHMPRMTGLELAAQLREEGIGIPMLLVTGSPSPAIVARAASLGIAAVLGKPAEPEALLNFVAVHARRRTP